jgi:hypothetical protein
MPPTTVTYEVTKEPLGAEQYRTTVEITETTNALDIELFVFETSSDAYVSVATRYTLESTPNSKAQAETDGNPYYRGAIVLKDHPTVEAADAYLTATLSRIQYLCLSIDRVAMPFTGTETGTVPD